MRSLLLITALLVLTSLTSVFSYRWAEQKTVSSCSTFDYISHTENFEKVVDQAITNSLMDPFEPVSTGLFSPLEKKHPLTKADTSNPEQLKVVISGCVRNVADYLPKVFDNIDKLRASFKECKILFFENDSTDKTLALLQDYQKKYPQEVIIISSNLQELDHPLSSKSNTLRLAYARNVILAMTQKYFANYDLLLNMDPDDICSPPIDMEVLLESLQTPNWDAISYLRVGANSVLQKGRDNCYYDLWALHMPGFEENCHQVGKRADNRLYMGKLYDHLMESIKEGKPVPVISAFNGLAIYKIPSIVGCTYKGCDSKTEAKKGKHTKLCEHVPFHRDMLAKHQASIVIYPKALFSE